MLSRLVSEARLHGIALASIRSYEQALDLYVPADYAGARLSAIDRGGAGEICLYTRHIPA